MADQKYIDLPPLVVQKTTDIYAVSDNGLSSYQETRPEMQAYMQANLSFLSSLLPDGQFFVGDAGNNAAPVTMSGDGTLTNAGVLSIPGLASKIESVIGTTNQVLVDNADPLNPVLSTPQDINTAATPTFESEVLRSDSLLTIPTQSFFQSQIPPSFQLLSTQTTDGLDSLFFQNSYYEENVYAWNSTSGNLSSRIDTHAFSNNLKKRITRFSGEDVSLGAGGLYSFGSSVSFSNNNIGGIASLGANDGTFVGTVTVGADATLPLETVTLQQLQAASGDIKTITGTTNQIIVNDLDPENIILSTPQDIAVTSSTTFANLKLEDKTSSFEPTLEFSELMLPVPLQVLSKTVVIGRNVLANPIYYSDATVYPTSVIDGAECTGFNWNVLTSGNTRSMLKYDGFDFSQGADGLATISVPLKLSASATVASNAVNPLEIVPLQQLQSALVDYLLKANNLSDVASATTSRANLDVPSTAGVGASGTWNIDISGNSATVTNGVYTLGVQSIAGLKTFTDQIVFSDTTVATTAFNGTAIIGSGGVQSVGIGGGNIITTGNVTAGGAVTVGTSGQFLLSGRADKRPLVTDTLGIVKTSNLVADIDWDSPIINSGQNAFNAYRSTTLSNVVGNSATPYKIIYNSTTLNKGSTITYNTGTGDATVITAGNYVLTGFLELAGLSNSHNIIRFYALVNGVNRFDMIDTTGDARDGNNQLGQSFCQQISLDLNDIVTIFIVVNGGALTVDLFGAPLTGTRNTFSMSLLN